MAPVWKLTGFLLAGELSTALFFVVACSTSNSFLSRLSPSGKPGILCLEGNPKAVDEFMAWVKAVSWSDIPSFQKSSSFSALYFRFLRSFRD